MKLNPGEDLAGNDNGDRSMLWISTDAGRSWRKHADGERFGTYGEMYPRFLKLADGRLMLTFTVRSGSTDGFPLGLRAILSEDDGDTWDFRRDRLVISYENTGSSGGGFGNTVQTPDGSLVSVYSYRKAGRKDVYRSGPLEIAPLISPVLRVNATVAMMRVPLLSICLFEFRCPLIETNVEVATVRKRLPTAGAIRGYAVFLASMRAWMEFRYSPPTPLRILST